MQVPVQVQHGHLNMRGDRRQTQKVPQLRWGQLPHHLLKREIMGIRPGPEALEVVHDAILKQVSRPDGEQVLVLSSRSDR